MSQTITVGIYLARKAIKRTSWLSKGFIIFIMTLTFLNLLFTRGILVGIPDSSLENTRTDETGDVLISKPDGETDIEGTYQLTQFLETAEEVSAYSVRYQTGSTIESDYQRSKKEGENASTRSVPIFAFDPVAEEKVTAFSRFIIEGRMLGARDFGSIILGNGLLEQYAVDNFTDEELLQGVEVGGKVLVTIAGTTKEFQVVGVSGGKGQAQNRAYILDKEYQLLANLNNPNASEIAVRLNNPRDDVVFSEMLRNTTFAEDAKVETSLQAAGEFLNDIKTIFDFLSLFIGSIGIFISAITIFIIIFINVVSRKQEVGIARAIGVNPVSIIISYVIQSMFYAISGVIVSLAIFYFFLVPYFLENPLDFPFTDVYLATDVAVITYQAIVLLVAAALAGYIPARMTINQQILSLILGR